MLAIIEIFFEVIFTLFGEVLLDEIDLSALWKARHVGVPVAGSLIVRPGPVKEMVAAGRDHWKRVGLGAPEHEQRNRDHQDGRVAKHSH